MQVFELVLALLLLGVGLTIVAPRLGLPWPALLAVSGGALALLPFVPTVTLDPRLALVLLVSPVLLDAAYDTSPRDLRANLAPLLSLVVVLVVLTTAAVAVVARAMQPDLPWPAALALGAIVAPPDAAAASAVLRQVRLPRRMTVLLGGESLLNDATALLLYRLAVGWAAGAAIGGLAALMLLLQVAGGVALGVALAWCFTALSRRVRLWTAHVVLQFLGTFAVWQLADALHLSAVLAVVAYAMRLARTAGQSAGPRSRRASYAVWEAAVFVLNMLAFILMGLQLRGIAAGAAGRAPHYLAFAAAVLATAVAVRFAWVTVYVAALRLRARLGASRDKALPTYRGALVMSWCGMRGIVTLAAALALPADFPQRELIVAAAMGVVLGTLVLQGLTLRPLLAWLSLPRDDSMKAEKLVARTELARAGLSALDGRTDDAARLLARDYETRLADPSLSRADPTGLREVHRRGLAAERSRLSELRRHGDISDDVFHIIEEELDWLQAEQDRG